MVMIKMLTHRGFCHVGGTTPALCSLGRYFASLLFNQSAILILRLQTVVCGFAQLTPGFPSAGSGGRGFSSRSLMGGRTRSVPVLSTTGSSKELLCLLLGRREEK